MRAATYAKALKSVRADTAFALQSPKPVSYTHLDVYKRQRLTKRYRALTSRGKRSTVAITAVARELAAFMWAIARLNLEQQIEA